MVKKSVKLEAISGGCCCYRNPYVESYEGVYLGSKPDDKSCAQACNQNPELYLGFMSCKEGTMDCVNLTNRQVGKRVEYMRSKYGPNVWSSVDLDQLLGKF